MPEWKKEKRDTQVFVTKVEFLHAKAYPKCLECFYQYWLLDSSFIYYLCTYLKQWRTVNCFIMRDNSRRWRIVQKAVWLLNKAPKKEVICHFFHLSDEGSQNNKKEEEEVCENEYKSHLISLIFLLITANFPLGPWERASVCCCHLICRLHISPCWAAPSVPSPRPPLAGACGEVGLLGPPLFRPGEESPERARSLRVGLSKKKKERKKRKT